VPDSTHLRIPGPTPLPETVRQAGSRQMINHRGPEFRELIGRVTERLQRAFVTDNDLLLLTCSGTGAMEAAVANHLSPADPVLAVSIGSFGDRFARIAERYGADVTRLEVEWGQAADADQVSDQLSAMAAAGRPARAILLTHNETSTGVENPLHELAAAVQRTSPDTLLIIDAVSGLGAVPFETDGWGLDVVATGSQKSWMVPPGLGMVSVSDRAWQAATTATMPRFYFDLTEARRLLANGETPWTPAVSVLFQLDVALDMLEAEGYPNVFARHAACAAGAQAGLAALGFRLFADPRHASKTVTAAYLPDGVDWTALNGELRRRGLVVAGGQGKLAGRILRVGHLGLVSPADIVAAMEIVGQAAAALGLPVDATAGAQAAEKAAEEAAILAALEAAGELSSPLGAVTAGA
jgi:aspartate aminotransferase-like enzyme